MRRTYSSILAFACTVAAFAAVPVRPSHACGGELPISCIDPQDAALSLLGRAVLALREDKDQALRMFSAQERGFRTVELYVFCIGPDGVVDAHPDRNIRGSAAFDLVDVDGVRFGEAMLRNAREGRVSAISYRWPTLGSDRPILRQGFYTRVGQEVCGVTSYDQ